MSCVVGSVSMCVNVCVCVRLRDGAFNTAMCVCVSRYEFFVVCIERGQSCLVQRICVLWKSTTHDEVWRGVCVRVFACV